MPSRAAAMGAWLPAWPAAWMLTFGLLVSSLAALFKTLDLRGYPSRTAPPQFRGSTLDARQLSLTEYRGRVIVLTFWATWCLECRVELPAPDRLQGEFLSRGLAVIGLPTTFIVGRDGRAIAFAIGPREWEGTPARALIGALLAELAPGPATQ